MNNQNEESIKEYLQELIDILKSLKEKEISDVVTNLKSSYGNLNATYPKSLAEQVAKFSQKGPDFLIWYINTFTEISQKEENRLTKYINDIKRINSYINEGLSYEEAKILTEKILIPVTIDNNEVRIIPHDTFSQGLTKDNKLIIVSELSKDIILSYIFLNQENYLRYLYQDAGRIIIPKLLITDKFNNIIDFKVADDLVSFNNSIIPQDDLLNVYNESNRLYNNLDQETLASVLKDVKDLRELNSNNSLIVSEDFVHTPSDNAGKKIL